MTTEHHHLPRITKDDVFNADVEYLSDIETNSSLASQLQALRDSNPFLYQRLLQRADTISHHNPEEFNKLLGFSLFTVLIIEHALERLETDGPPETAEQ